MSELKGSVGRELGRTNPWQTLAARTEASEVSPLHEKLQRQPSSFKEHLLYGIPSVLAGAADTFGTSLGLLDENAMSNGLDSLGEDFGRYYQTNETGVKVLGDLAAMFIPGMLGVKAIRGGSFVYNALKGVGAGDRMLNAIFTSGKSRQMVMEAVKAHDVYATGSKVGTLDLLDDIVRQGLVRSATLTKVTDGIKEAVAFEAGVFATMNDSQTLYPDEFSALELIAMNSVFPGVFAGVEFSIMKRLARESADSVAKAAYASVNQLGLPLEEVIHRMGARDLGLVVDSLAALSTKQLAETTSEQVGKTNFNRAMLTFQEAMNTQIKRIMGEAPIKDLTKSAPTGDNNPVVNTVMHAQEVNPYTHLGTISIEPLPMTFNEVLERMALRDDMVKGLNDEIDGLFARYDDLDGHELARLEDAHAERTEFEGLSFFIQEVDGTLTPAMSRKNIFQDAPTPITTEVDQVANKIFYAAKIPTHSAGGKARKIGVDTEYRLNLPGNRTGKLSGVDAGEIIKPSIDPIQASFEALTPYQRSAVYHMLGQAITTYGNRQGKVLSQLTELDHHTTIDAVLETIGRYGDEAQDFKLPGSMQSLDELELLGLQKKFIEYTRLRDMQNANHLIKPSAENQLNHIDIQKMLNLPGSVAADGSPHPLMELFEATYRNSQKDFKAIFKSVDDVNGAMYELVRFPDLLEATATPPRLSLRGSMLSITEDMAPGLVVKKAIDPAAYSRDGLVSAMTFQRTEMLHKMSRADQANATLVQGIFDYFVGNPNTAFVRDVPSMIQGSQRGKGVFFQQSHVAADNPILSSTIEVMDGAVRTYRAEVGRLWDVHTPVLNRLQAPANRADLENLNLFMHARRQGWDLEADVVPLSEGLSGFKLAVTRDNKERWVRLFDEPMPEDAMMPSPTKLGGTPKPLGMTATALEGADALRQLGLATQENTNFLRKLAGQGRGNVKEWWVPPKNFSRDEIVFVIDGAGAVRGTIGAPTLAGARRKAEQELAQAPENYFIVDRNDVERYLGLTDEAFFPMRDFTDPINQTGKAKGTSVFQVVDTGPEVLKDALGGISRQFESILRRSTSMYFEPQINLARKMFKASGSPQAEKGRTVWQQYLGALYDTPGLNPNEITGRAYYAIESIWDDVWNGLNEKLGLLKRPPHQAPTKGDAKLYNSLEAKLGEFNPFTDTVDFLERTHKVKIPSNMKQHMGKLTQFTSLLTLRFMEVGHSVLTLTSLGATLPGVIKALQPTADEIASGAAGTARWQTRIQAHGVPLTEKHAMYSPVRAMATTMHEMFTPAGNAIWKRASQKGYLDQAIAEQMKTLTNPAAGYVTNLMKKYGRMTTFLSDESEKLARGISFMHGVTIAKQLGMKGDDATFAFAHKLANQTIGNYSPTNRPKIFQGAAGMPLGLFMTFMWNYYQRIFDYAARGQKAALGWQYFSQSAIFGASTVPGFQQFNDFFAASYDGSMNPIDGIANTYGQETADWFLYGTLSNLPKLFGAPDGVGLYSRGDVTFRNVPTLFSAADSPVVKMIGNGFGAIRETVQMFAQGGATDQQIAEILSTYSTNRFVRNMAQTYTGDVVDKRGQLIGHTPTFEDIMKGEIKDEMALIARGLGMRTLNEAKKVSAHMRIRATEYTQQYQLMQLRDRARAMARKGALEGEEIEHMLGKYIQYGGRPENYGNWLTNQHMAATVDKSLLKLLDVMDDPTRQYDINRLMSGLVLPENDPEFD